MKHILPLVFFLFLFANISDAQSRAWYSTSAKTQRTTINPDIQVFPNPTTSHFGITEVNGVKKIIIFNLVGRKMKQYQDIAKDKRYFIGDLPKGMYLVQMIGGDSKIITTKRISKR